MSLMMQQYIFALIEGIGLILSPCILPVLPLVLATSATGGSARPFGIITGFIAAFTAFALFSRALIQQTGIDTEVIRHISLILLLGFGVILLFDALGARFMTLTENLARRGADAITKRDTGGGFTSGVLIGALIGFVWTPCAGPIMAAAIIQVVQAETNLHAAMITLMFVTGAGIPMLALSLFGRGLAHKLGGLKKHTAALRRGTGVVIIIMAALIWSGADVALLTKAPGNVARFDRASTELLYPLENPYDAPAIADIEKWFNTDTPLQLADLKGKVVLIDFWTYSCINCVRTLPYVTAWYERYKDDGFVVIGVHTPEFAFEKKPENVQNALTKHGINYPVGMDNRWGTWKSFKNKYWPAHYLINKEGRVVYTHYGEGNYPIMENNIRYLLGIHAAVPGAEVNPVGKSAAGQTAETYLGTWRAKNFLPQDGLKTDADHTYAFSDSLPLHHWSLNGDWLAEKYNVTALSSGAKLRLHFKSGKVFLVMGTLDGNPVDVQIKLNGKAVSARAAGKDVKDGRLTVTHETIYELVAQNTVTDAVLEIEADRAGLQAYAFTFGQ